MKTLCGILATLVALGIYLSCYTGNPPWPGPDPTAPPRVFVSPDAGHHDGGDR